MAYLLSVLAGAVSAAAEPPARGRFVPGEIIVKFRETADATEVAIDLRASDKSIKQAALGAVQGRWQVWEVTPLIEHFDRHLGKLRLSRVRQESRTVRAQSQSRRPRHPREPGIGGNRIYRVRVDLEAGQDIEGVLAAWRSHPDVEYAELNPIISICAIPGDARYLDQWSLSKIQAPEAWDTCRGAADVVVAVIDTGVDYTHRDLQGNLWVNEAELNGAAGVDDDRNGYIDDVYGYNFAYNNSDPADDHGHGTHCAGIIAAVGDNGLDVAGICWTARIMAIKILGSDGDGNTADAIPAIYYAVANGADIISGSWGGEDASDALREAIAYARREGVAVVAAAGNEGSSKPFYPAAYPDVISVAATDASDRRWYLSNYGDWVDIAAPGRDIWSLSPPALSKGIGGNAHISSMSGTSMAAPHVSGACALLLAADPFLGCAELEDILRVSVDPIAPGICAANGRLNLYRVLRTVIPADGMIRLDRAAYAEGADVGILVADWDLGGVGQQAVLMEAGSGDEEMAILAETPVAVGVFRGAVATQSATAKPGDGILQVRDGESIYARYVDGGDAAGQADRWRQAEAVADYLAPSITRLTVEAQGRTATVRVLTSEPARVEIHYGTTCGGPYERIVRGLELADWHEIHLRGLIPRTQYCFLVALTDAAGNERMADNDGRGYSFVVDSAFGGFRVPGVYPTIQAAIDDATDGDTVWVGDGTYSGVGNIELDFLGKAITLRSENGPATCIIDCNELGRAFYFHGGETAESVLDGFTIANGSSASFGGGIRCMGSSPTIRNCIFRGNAAGRYGGGLCNSYGSRPVVINCTFEDNVCAPTGRFGRGGGMANRQGSHPVVTDCTFIANAAGHSAGALGNFDGSSPVVTRCTFTRNSVNYMGGAVGNESASRPVFRQCVFSGNRANDGGAVSNLAGSGPVLENCIFDDNRADDLGGAMQNYSAAVSLSNCTFSGNHAEGVCGGIWSGVDSQVRLDNCILWRNTDGAGGAGNELAQLIADDSDLTVMHCCVQGWTGALAGIGNLGVDPLFVGAAGGDFHLKSNGWRWDRLLERWTYDAVTSPCIDAGNPGWPMGDEPLHVPDDPNSTLAVNTRIDMGAYGGTAEASLAPPGWALRTDVDNNGTVDWLDLRYIAARWAQREDRLETDFTRDGATGGADFALLATQWRHRAIPPAVRTATPNR